MTMFDAFCTYTITWAPTLYDRWSCSRQMLADIGIASAAPQSPTRVMVIDAQNIAEYYLRGTSPDTEPDMGDAVFGCLRLPAPHVWIEFRLPAFWNRVCTVQRDTFLTNRGWDASVYAPITKTALFLTMPEAHTLAITGIWGNREEEFLITPSTLLLSLNETYEWAGRTGLGHMRLCWLMRGGSLQCHGVSGITNPAIGSFTPVGN